MNKVCTCYFDGDIVDTNLCPVHGRGMKSDMSKNDWAGL